jgi:iron complex transport system permease protein
VLAALAALALASLVVALLLGSVALSPGAAVRALFGDRSDPLAAAVVELRLPRAFAALIVGGLLAFSGAVLQALLRNALADPYVLGISGGAAFGALAALLAGAGMAAVQAGGVAGALLVLVLLFVLARRALFVGEGLPGEDPTAVLLIGVMLAALSAAGIGMLLAVAPDGRLRPMVFWLLGDLSAAGDATTVVAGTAMLATVLLAARFDARALNAMVNGDLQAYAQGVDVAATRRRLILLAALATAGAVNVAGAVGFVGFAAPHLVRRLVGNDQRVVLPASALAGGALVVLADTLARTVVAPLQLPVGAVTALLGVPVFLWLMRRP